MRKDPDIASAVAAIRTLLEFLKRDKGKLRPSRSIQAQNLKKSFTDEISCEYLDVLSVFSLVTCSCMKDVELDILLQEIW